MKRSIQSLFIIISFILFSVEVNAQWVQTNGPYGGRVTALAVDSNNTIYAGTSYGGLYFSTNNGQSWENKLNSGSISCISFYGDNIYIGTTLNGLFRSSDSGITWVQIGVGSLMGISCIAVDSSGRVFVGQAGAGPNSGVWRSLDNGITWEDLDSGFTSVPSRMIQSISIGLNDEVFVGTQEGVFRSVDHGLRWSQIDNGLASTYINSVSALKNGYVFAGTQNGVYRSTDNGNNWSFDFPPGWQIGIKVTDIISNYKGEIVASTEYYGILQSTDFGNTWWQNLKGLIGGAFYSIIEDNNGKIYSGTYGDGVFTLNNNDTAWTNSKIGMTATFGQAMAVKDSILYVGTEGGGIFYSIDKGTTWVHTNDKSIKLLSRYTEFARSLVIDKRGNLYCGTGTGGIYRTTNNGDSWDSLGPNFTVPFIGINGLNYILAGTDANGIYISKDNGKSWNSIDNGLKEPRVGSMVIDSNNNIFIVTGDWNIPGIFRSTDDGNTWDTLGIKMNSYAGAILAIDNNNNIYCCTSTSKNFIPDDNTDVLYKSTDNGNSWSSLNISLTISIQNIFIDKGNNIFISGTSWNLNDNENQYYIFKSTDGGISWVDITNNLPNNQILSLIEDPNGNIYAGLKGNGVYRLDNKTTEIKKTNAIENFNLSQNYPNPFNPSTIIRYSVPKSTMVTIKVYDVLGKVVTTLENEEKSAGNYSVNFNASKLSSGVYFYRMQAGSFTETRKLILLK